MHATTRRASLTAALAALLAVSDPSRAEAQWPGARGSSAHAEGYRDGSRAGADDARDGRGFEYQRHRDYRDGDRGYGGRDGNRDAYTQQYRAGFIAGYRDGYYAVGPPGPAGGYAPPTAGGRYGGWGGAARIAHARGLDEGYSKGFADGRDRDRRDPWRHSWYRDGDRGYRRDYGPRALYQRAYRAAFERGYYQGYEDGRRRRGRGPDWRW